MGPERAGIVFVPGQSGMGKEEHWCIIPPVGNHDLGP